MAMTETRTVTDARHRVPYPSSRPRRVALVALGDEGVRLAAALDRARLPHVDVIELSRSACTPTPDTLLSAIAERSGDLASAFEGADMIYLVCGPDDDVGFAAPISQIAHHRGVLVTGVLIHRETARSDARREPESAPAGVRHAGDRHRGRLSGGDARRGRDGGHGGRRR